MGIDVFAPAAQTLIGILCNSTLGVRRREQAKPLLLHKILAECCGGVAAAIGRAAPALSPRLRQIARCEHVRQPVKITIESFGIAPHGAPAHARGQFDP